MTHSVPVPGLVDSASPAYDWQAYDYHWHRRTFVVPETDRRDLAFLCIEQAMFGTEVWMNGTRLGGDIACYTSQEYDCGRAIRYGSENELIVRVGAKATLPAESAVGNDQERATFIPGIWGDVHLTLSGNPRIRLVQIIPHIEAKTAEVRCWVENRSDRDLPVGLRLRVFAKRSGLSASEEVSQLVVSKANRDTLIVEELLLDGATLWSPEHPFLYELESTLLHDGRAADRCRTSFGMREFTIRGGDFFLNGVKKYLRGGNIAFHRFLSDRERASLPWNLAWVRKLLIDIPKAHHFNFFRIHIGHAYNRWYDLADEHGMLLQDEWPFWTTRGTKEQITREFTRWLQDNWNHPSIVIWDPLNESSDDAVQKEIVPEMKRLDPTRPWESVDFVEQHPYIYSLGPVLVERKFGFTESLETIERSPVPTVINEFLWWWLDKEFNPTALTGDVIERWLGPHPTAAELQARQLFLAQELVELFRRMRVDAIQPFVYLSNNAGPTAHWFLGEIKDLQPKPVLGVLKNAFAPFGVSVELWDRHFVPQEERTVRVFVFNDEPAMHSGTLRFGIADREGRWLQRNEHTVSVAGNDTLAEALRLKFPATPGEYRVRAELLRSVEDGIVSEKEAHVLPDPHTSLAQSTIGLLGVQQEIAEFLQSRNVRCEDAGQAPLDLAVIVASSARHCQSRLGELTRWVSAGNTLVLIEPERGIEGREVQNILEGIELSIQRRPDADRGGFDSYLFAADHRHPLWKGIQPEHLKMFNGGFGGEVVSQHDIVPNVDCDVLARCGLKLGTAAVFEMRTGLGRVIVSRLQLRGRLANPEHSDELYARRNDPVLQRFFLNLLEYAARR